MRRQIDEDEIDREAGEDFITFCTQDELDMEIASEQLVKCMGEEHITCLVRAGYLTSEVTGRSRAANLQLRICGQRSVSATGRDQCLLQAEISGCCRQRLVAATDRDQRLLNAEIGGSY